MGDEAEVEGEAGGFVVGVVAEGEVVLGARGGVVVVAGVDKGCEGLEVSLKVME
jgi:hypothetical protein